MNPQWNRLMLANRSVDLHVHTLASEGQETLSNQLAYAKASGLRAIALTDLDVLPNLEECHALARHHGVDCIPGVEISCGWQGTEVHVLGYHINPRHRRLRERLAQIRDSRTAHVQIMLYKLNKQGISLQFSDIQSQTLLSSFMGRIHIARAMATKGYIDTPREAFTPQYLGVDGECYYPTSSLPAIDAISLIRDAGGIAVLAHPALYNHRAGLGELEIGSLKDAGLRGVEALHACHTISEVRKYSTIAHRLDLIITGGSSCRGVNYDPVVNHKPFLTDDVLAELMRKREAA